MASIDARGPYQYRARIRRKAGDRVVTISKTFTNLTDAQTWAMIQEGKVVGDEYVDRKLVQATTVRQACEWFKDRIAPKDRKTEKRMPKTAHAKNQLSRLRYWCASEFADWSLVSLKPWDLIEWRDELLSEGECAAQTIVHRLNTLSQVYVNFALAQKVELTNPVGEKVRPSLGQGRDRRLSPHPDAGGDDEETRLLKACGGGTRPWLRAAVIISLETAMRQAELAGLTWDRVMLNAEYPHCDLPRTKNERPRRVPLSTRAIAAMRSLLPENVAVLGKRKVFPVETPRAFGHAWRDVVNDENFPNLRWHDLRHEAISRLFERTDLRDNEIMAISGHLRPEMLTRYTHLRADRLGVRLG
ncbi:Integrase/recombinase [uncultured Alphaproteobacteria bacterium]|uniref:Integrase/recombinase n=1 Tax=uncultured Alphaproteobacteria bacterium TaxID=91750 RepID=A0A212JMY7_9PROT|nr:Integrase/recombinase [uncultured Alphaproteobacteria bacterium]